MKTIEVIEAWERGELSRAELEISLFESISSIEDAKLAKEFATKEGELKRLEDTVSHSRENRKLNVFSSAGYFYDIDMDKQLTFWDNMNG